MQTARSTVMKQPPEYSKAWSFRTQLTMPPIPPGNQHSVDITTQILRTQILPARPDRVTHIEARYKSAESSGAVLSLEGYLQHSSGINRNQLNSWFRAEWTPVGGRLSVNADYKAYRASMCDLAYIHVQVHGEHGCWAVRVGLMPVWPVTSFFCIIRKLVTL